MPGAMPDALLNTICVPSLVMVPVDVAKLLAVAFWLTVTRAPLVLTTVEPAGMPKPLTGSPLLNETPWNIEIMLLPRLM